MRKYLTYAGAALALAVAAVCLHVGPAEAASRLGQFILVHDPASTAATEATFIVDVVNHEANELAIAVKSGATGRFTVDEDGDLTATSVTIGGTALTSTAAELNLIDGAEKVPKIEVVPLAAVDTAGGIAAWTPGARKLLHHVLLDVTTKSTGASTTDCGIAANATTLNDTLIDGADTGTAAALFDSSDGTDNGTNGVAKTRAVGATESVTCSIASGASAGIVGNLYIFYSDI